LGVAELLPWARGWFDHPNFAQSLSHPFSFLFFF